VDPLEVDRDAADLHAANRLAADDRDWTYLPYGPFADLEEYRGWLRAMATGTDPLFFTLREARSGKAAGVAAYLRIDPRQGSIEVGHLKFSPLLQRTPAATEAMYLMMRQAFELGYRRYEWKCDHLNERSRKAAERLGFTFEGIFRQAGVYKGRNRDTAWFSILDSEWPAIRGALERWLDPGNFGLEGRQQASLRELVASALRRR
jgi:RimJ/RimL family protein N-acetyltransferase